MNVEEEFQKLKNFIAEFKEEIKSQQLELDALKRNLDNQQRELDDKKRYIDLLDRKLERIASTMINKNSQVLTTSAQIRSSTSGKSDNVTEEFNALANVQDRFNLKI